MKAYSLGAQPPEENVTRPQPSPVRPDLEAYALAAADQALAERQVWHPNAYDQGRYVGIRQGFIVGILCGAAGIAVLAAAVLGDWAESIAG